MPQRKCKEGKKRKNFKMVAVSKCVRHRSEQKVIDHGDFSLRYGLADKYGNYDGTVTIKPNGSKPRSRTGDKKLAFCVMRGAPVFNDGKAMTQGQWEHLEPNTCYKITNSSTTEECELGWFYG